MDVDAFDYPLPASAVAQVPLRQRDAARLLVDLEPDGDPIHRHVADLADLLEPDDLLVVNDTRVRPARLALRKPTGGEVEVLLLERRSDGWWEALVRPSRRVPDGSVLTTGDGELSVEVDADLGAGRRLVRLNRGSGADDESAAIQHYGQVPLPPYIHRPLDDPERYQTVFADRPGSAAAPTAGLHLTNEVLERCRRRGVGVASIELQVGLGTFRPISADKVEDHHVHAERYSVPAEAFDACRGARRVVAVGTTVVRALETAAATGQLEGRTELFIRRGHRFRAVDLLLTNFHVPRSSLLVLVDAFVGDRWRRLYDLALADGYRFLSFGDAMFLCRREAQV